MRFFNEFSIKVRGMSLLLAAFCVLMSGCDNSRVIWHGASRAPSGAWVAEAEMRQWSGPGNNLVETIVFLRQSSSRDRTEVLALANESAYPDGIAAIAMNWVDASHLELVYKDHARIDFQAVKCSGIDISVRNAPGNAANASQ